VSSETEETKLSIFEAVGKKQQEQAIRAWLTGRTPQKDIREREARGGGKVKYVNTYYMTRQLSLITGMRWSSEALEEKARPSWDNPDEVMVKIRVSYWDNFGNQYGHTAWGSKDVARYKEFRDKAGRITNPNQAGKIISLGDDLKAAESDAIKKAISYIGIADDIYGGRELSLEDLTAETPGSPVSQDDYKNYFVKIISEKHKVLWSEIFTILKIKSVEEITDWKRALEEVMKAKNIKE
jgi:hypothetical protein